MRRINVFLDFLLDGIAELIRGRVEKTISGANIRHWLGCVYSLLVSVTTCLTSFPGPPQGSLKKKTSPCLECEFVLMVYKTRSCRSNLPR